MSVYNPTGSGNVHMDASISGGKKVAAKKAAVKKASGNTAKAVKSATKTTKGNAAKSTASKMAPGMKTHGGPNC